jgi:mRNA-degrading endonuclease RelE of RelBE toxin-antitoxin system
VLEISENPWHKGTIKVEGYTNIRRKRVGRYRILYFVDKLKKEVLVIKVELRDEETYKLK